MSSKRSKASRPKAINVKFLSDDGSYYVKAVNRSEYPAPFLMYKFGLANQLSGLRPGTGIFDFDPILISNKDEVARFSKDHGNMVLNLKFEPHILARALAKMAYAFAVAELGLNGFEASRHTLDVILNRTDDVAHTVGGEKI